MKIVIVGGVAGGASAAARARRLSESADIILFERGPDISFANCGLPYFIGNTIKNRASLLVTTPDKLRQRFKVDVRTLTEVIAIDRQNRSVTVCDVAQGHEYQESYDRLILATGAAPFLPAIPGTSLPGVYTLRTLTDMDRIKKAVESNARHAVIIGAGFIGVELVENLLNLNLQVTLVELDKQILPPFDPEMTTPFLRALRDKGVQTLLGQTAQSIALVDGRLAMTLTGGSHVVADLIIIGVGVRPENRLAMAAGLQVGPRGGIRVNKQLQTSDPNIYAVGDVVETENFVSRSPAQVPLAGPANRQGRIAADHIFGKPAQFRGTQGTAIIGFFDRVAALTGMGEKSLRAAGRPYQKIYIHPAHHAGYYPGAESMSIKLIFDPDNGKILGAQAVGGAGVDKRIDILAVSIQAGMSVFDLEEMELCYAPQFGSAKDPINMAGFVASNHLRGEHPLFHAEDLKDPARFNPEMGVLIDVRTEHEFSLGHIPYAINIPVDELRQRLGELPSTRPVITYCQVGQRGYLAARILLQAGYQVRNLSGGYSTYRLHHPEL